MSSRLLALVPCLACLAAGSPASRLAAEPALLFPGEFHGDEVSATSGESWLALVRGDGGSDRLISVALEVDTVADQIVDEEGAATGRRVAAAGDPAPILFFVRDLPGVPPGDVETVVGGLGLEPGLEPNRPIHLTLRGGAASLLELRCEAPRLAQEWEEVGGALVYSRDAREQVLNTYSASYHDGVFEGLGSSAFAAIVWAGDLNGDAELDLVVDLTDHYNVALPTLFLSPGPGDPRLLVRIAEHRSVGC